MCTTLYDFYVLLLPIMTIVNHLSKSLKTRLNNLETLCNHSLSAQCIYNINIHLYPLKVLVDDIIYPRFLLCRVYLVTSIIFTRYVRFL